MKVLRSQEEAIKENITGAALTIGSFDGVHRGHGFLLRRLRDMSPQGPLVVMTFDPHPATVLSSRPMARIFPTDDQISVFTALGVDYLYFLPFKPEVAELSAVDFATKTIFDLFRPAALLVGYDFAFGKNRVGNYELLKKMAISYHCQTEQCEPFKLDGLVVSSSRIRELVSQGQVQQASKLLGRSFYIQRPVVEGKKLGRTIGVPTANFGKFTSSELTPGLGVYMTSVQIEDRQFFSITNVGTNPTVTNDLIIKIETYILDFDQDLYGKIIKVVFLEKIREEKKFSSLDDLKKEIQKDILWARNFARTQSKV